MLTALIDEIRRQEALGDSWSVTANLLQGLVKMTEEQYYQEVYGAEIAGNPLVTLADAAGPFSQHTIRQLVAVLEQLLGSHTVPALEHAGVFFAHGEQAELMALFLAAAAGAVDEHEFQADTFTAMLQTFGRLPQARQAYLQHYFDLAAIQDQTARTYCASRSFAIPDLAVRNAAGLLRFLLQKHILREESIFARLQDDFLEAAIRAGFATRPRQEQGQRKQPLHVRPPTDVARQTMGIGPGPILLSQLQASYKALMKRYHPDINPTGLRRAQEINAAYSALVAGAD